MVETVEEVRKRLETNRDLNELIKSLGDDFKPARPIADEILKDEIRNNKINWESILPEIESTNLPRLWVWSVINEIDNNTLVRRHLVKTYKEDNRLPKLAEKLLLMWKSTSPHSSHDDDKFKELIHSIDSEYQADGQSSETLKLLLDWCSEPTIINEIKFLEKLLEINKTDENDKEIAKTLLVLSNAWEDIDPLRRREYLQELHEHEVRRGNDTYIWITILSLAQWAKKYSPEEEGHYWKKLLDEHRRMGNRVGIYRTYRHLYYWSREYEKEESFNYLTILLEHNKKDNNLFGQSITYLEFSRWAQDNKPEDELKYLRLLYQTNKELGRYHHLRSSIQKLLEFKSKLTMEERRESLTELRNAAREQNDFVTERYALLEQWKNSIKYKEPFKKADYNELKKFANNKEDAALQGFFLWDEKKDSAAISQLRFSRLDSKNAIYLLHWGLATISDVTQVPQIEQFRKSIEDAMHYRTKSYLDRLYLRENELMRKLLNYPYPMNRGFQKDLMYHVGIRSYWDRFFDNGIYVCLPWEIPAYVNTFINDVSQPKNTVVIDLANVLETIADDYGAGRTITSVLQSMVNNMEEKDLKPLAVYITPGLIYRWYQGIRFFINFFDKKGASIHMSSSPLSEDWYSIFHAINTNSYILTNDLHRDECRTYPKVRDILNQSRIQFALTDDDVVLSYP